MKIRSALLVPALALSVAAAPVSAGQTRQTLPKAAKDILKDNRKERPAIFGPKDGSVVSLTGKGVTSIQVYRDGDSNTATGIPYYITFDKKRIIRHAGEYDGTDGVIDTYYTHDTDALSRAISMIDEYGLWSTAFRTGESVRGVTRIKIFRNGKLWITLQQSDRGTNVNRDMQALVDRLTEMAGGIPGYQPLTPDVIDDTPDIDIFND